MKWYIYRLENINTSNTTQATLIQLFKLITCQNINNSVVYIVKQYHHMKIILRFHNSARKAHSRAVILTKGYHFQKSGRRSRRSHFFALIALLRR